METRPLSSTYRPWKHLLLWFGLVAMILLRMPSLWAPRQFMAEDGRVFFADAWSLPVWESVLLPYAGYFHLLPRLLAEMASLLPLAWQPTLFPLLATAVNALIFSLFFLPHFRRLIASDATRGGICLLFPLLPHAENLGLLLGLHWYLAFALALVLVMDFPTRWAGRLALLGGGILTAWSSPSTLVLAPFFLGAAYRGRGSVAGRGYAILFLNLCVVGVFVLLLRLAGGDRTGTFSPEDLGPALDRLVFRGWIATTFLGNGVTSPLAEQLPFLLSALGVGGLALLLWSLARSRSPAANSAALLFLTGFLMVLFSLARTLYLSELAEIPLPRHDRYLTAPTLLLLTASSVLLVSALRWHPYILRTLFLLYAGLLFLGLPKQTHWARQAIYFDFQTSLPAIRAWENRMRPEGTPASLYLPHDIPYDGVVLRIQGGETLPPEVGLPNALGASLNRHTMVWHSWMGSFRTAPESHWIRHENRGRLKYVGMTGGRVWFHDTDGRLLFTSPLLYPLFWTVDGEQFRLD